MLLLVFSYVCQQDLEYQSLFRICLLVLALLAFSNEIFGDGSNPVSLGSGKVVMEHHLLFTRLLKLTQMRSYDG